VAQHLLLAPVHGAGDPDRLVAVADVAGYVGLAAQTQDAGLADCRALRGVVGRLRSSKANPVRPGDGPKR
jgi:hypothetical protein